MKNTCLALLSALMIITVTSCKEDIDYVGKINQQDVPAIAVEKNNNQLMVTWTSAQYEHLAAYVVTDLVLETEELNMKEVEAGTESCSFEATPGTHHITLQLKDTQGNLSVNSSEAEIYVSNVADVYSLVQEDTYDADNALVVVTDVFKNGAPMNMLSQFNSVTFTDMVVEGADVYVSGYYYNDPATKDYRVAAYWKNGVKTVLQDDASNPAYTSSIDVYNGSVTVAGYYYNSSNIFSHISTLWVDGVRNDINADAPGYIQANYQEGNRLVVNENGTYYAFNTMDASYNNQAFVYINGTVDQIGGPWGFFDPATQLPGGVAADADNMCVVTSTGFYTINLTSSTAEFTDLTGKNLRGGELTEEGSLHIAGGKTDGSALRLTYWAPDDATGSMLNGTQDLSNIQKTKGTYTRDYMGDLYITTTFNNGADVFYPVMFKNGEEISGYYSVSNNSTYVIDLEVAERPII